MKSVLSLDNPAAAFDTCSSGPISAYDRFKASHAASLSSPAPERTIWFRIEVFMVSTAAVFGRVPTRSNESAKSRPYWLLLTYVFVAYAIAGELGLSVPFTDSNVSPLWYPAGIALGCVVLLGPRVWPAIFAAAFAVNAASHIPVAAALGIACGNTLSAVLGGWLLRRTRSFQGTLDRVRDVLRLSLLGGFCATLVAASIGILALFLTGVVPRVGIEAAWRMWWLGDTLGVVIVTPLLLNFGTLRAARLGRKLELCVVVALALLSSSVVFTSEFGVTRPDIFAFGVFPFVLWAALRFGVFGTASLTLVLSVLASYGTAKGLGPFIKGSASQNIALLQAFFAITAMSGVILAAAIAERTSIARKQSAALLDRHSREKIALLSKAVEQTADSVVITDYDGIIQYVNPAFEKITEYLTPEVIGNTLHILRSGLHSDAFYEELWAKILGGETFRGTLANRTKSGELFWTEQTISPIKDDASRTTHFVSVQKDVTDLRKHQEHHVRLRLAREVQQRFYRSAAISVAGFDIGTSACPADETGGDYIDLFSLPDRRICIGIGDVSGHGIDAALVMSSTRAYVRSFAQMEISLPQILQRVNQMLLEDLESDRYVTLLLVVLDSSRATLTYASAGHIPGFVLCEKGEILSSLESSGPPLGLFHNSTFTEATIPLATGQTVVLLTDGAPETTGRADIQFGYEGVLAYVRSHLHASARDISNGICTTARQFADGKPQSDDITNAIVKPA